MLCEISWNSIGIVMKLDDRDYMVKILNEFEDLRRSYETFVTGICFTDCLRSEFLVSWV